MKTSIVRKSSNDELVIDVDVDDLSSIGVEVGDYITWSMHGCNASFRKFEGSDFTVCVCGSTASVQHSKDNEIFANVEVPVNSTANELRKFIDQLEIVLNNRLIAAKNITKITN